MSVSSYAAVANRANRTAVACLLWFVSSTQSAAQSQAPSYGPADLDAAFERDTLVISASEHACHRFHVWLARDWPQQRRGLMFVRDLPVDAGMLFVYDGPGPRSMWMKNTYIPLDILFVRDDGTISSIIAETEPLSLRSLASTEPVTYVLELGGGVTRSLHIASGDRLFWSEPASQ